MKLIKIQNIEKNQAIMVKYNVETVANDTHFLGNEDD